MLVYVKDSTAVGDSGRSARSAPTASAAIYFKIAGR